MLNPDEMHFDVVVVGGGPGGSTAATLIAMQGHRVLLLEKDRYPIYKIGESLLPATVHGICPMLGVDKALKEAAFIVKRGGTFRWGKSEEPWTFTFGFSPKMAGPYSTAYQVERSRFDMILLNNAREKGVDVREGCCVREVVDNEGQHVRVAFTDEQGTEHRVTSRYLIDASGHKSVIAREVGTRIYSEFFQNVALFGYFTGGKRLPEPNRGNILTVAFKRGWFWYIPLSESLTSVGAVIGREHAKAVSGDRESAYRELIASCPLIQSMLSDASRVTSGMYGELRIRTDYSYTSSRFWKGKMLLVGDAACFVDPVFSSGVHLATYAGLLAARSVNTCLSNQLDEVKCFEEFERRYRREYQNFYNFLVGFYDVNHDLDDYFWQARKVTHSQEIDSHAFLNLVGGVETKEALGAQLFPGAAKLSREDIDNKWREGFFIKLAGELTQVQLQALYKDSRPQESPLFPDGLVPSADGFHWRLPDSARTT